MEYRLIDVTPKPMRCCIGSCPAIYEAVDVTPKPMRCLIGSCPSVHQTSEDYLIVGTQVDPAEAGLVGKVGKGEVLVRVPRKLIDERER